MCEIVLLLWTLALCKIFWTMPRCLSGGFDVPLGGVFAQIGANFLDISGGLHNFDGTYFSLDFVVMFVIMWAFVFLFAT